jgi:hypothetical protein
MTGSGVLADDDDACLRMARLELVGKADYLDIRRRGD